MRKARLRAVRLAWAMVSCRSGARLNWAGPYDSSDTGRQVSALDLLITQVTGVGNPVPGLALPRHSAQP